MGQQQPTLRATPVPSSIKAQIDQFGGDVAEIADEVENTTLQLGETSFDVTHDITTLQQESTTSQQQQQKQNRWLNLKGPTLHNIEGDISSTN